MNSSKWQFNMADFKKVMHNALVFLSPIVLLYLTFVYSNIKLDGFALTDFVPDNATISLFSLYVLNVLLDFFRKLRQNNTQLETPPTVINS
jgi:hypothetical protein